MNGLIELLKDKKHVIWDWNGTLLNDVDHAVTTVNRLLTVRGLPQIEKEYYRQVFEFPVINYYKAIGFNFERESFEDVSHEFVQLYMDGFHHCPLVFGAKDTLETIQALKITQSILSAADQESLDVMVSHFELKQYFSSVNGIENKFASSKIQKGMDLISSSSHGLSETVLIGDTEHDLEVGQHLGIDVVLVGHGHQCPTRLSRVHDKVIN
ncbi:MAG: HAD family hydrolase [Pseudobdellovibrionaceae bacterium]